MSHDFRRHGCRHGRRGRGEQPSSLPAADVPLMLTRGLVYSETTTLTYTAAVDQYIVVDTNILIGDLPLVKALFNVLSIPNLPTIANLLIPSIVNHGELYSLLFT